MIIHEVAPAKINLALHVTGLRADGLHLLDSVVAFAELGDLVSVEPERELSLAIKGPFADGLAMENNLVLDAALCFDRPAGKIELTKNLPVASGIGGGSADAAATIRVFSKMLGNKLEPAKILSLGADVPVCLEAKPMQMSGVGERLTSITNLPDLPAVLVNPNQPLSTSGVFSELGKKENAALEPLPQSSSTEDWIAYLRSCRNDLQSAAINILPEISTVLDALEDAALARMSGSGATCFGIYETREEAQSACQRIQKNHPNWWVQVTTIKGSR